MEEFSYLPLAIQLNLGQNRVEASLDPSSLSGPCECQERDPACGLWSVPPAGMLE